MKNLKTISLALLTVAISIWGYTVHAYFKSPKVILENRIAGFNEVQADLSFANNSLREILPTKEQAAEEARQVLKEAEQEVQDVKVNIYANSARYDAIQRFKVLDMQQLEAIIESEKNIGSGK